MTQIQKYADFLNGKTASHEGGTVWKMDLKETVAELFSRLPGIEHAAFRIN